MNSCHISSHGGGGGGVGFSIFGFRFFYWPCVEPFISCIWMLTVGAGESDSRLQEVNVYLH